MESIGLTYSALAAAALTGAATAAAATTAAAVAIPSTTFGTCPFWQLITKSLFRHRDLELLHRFPPFLQDIFIVVNSSGCVKKMGEGKVLVLAKDCPV